MKSLPITLALLTFLSPHLMAQEENINPDTARAYQGYLLTFVWPERYTNEHVDYENVLTLDGLIRESFDADADQQLSTEQTSQTLPSVFDDFDKKLDRRVQILSNQKWTLIFKDRGDVIHKRFTSPENKDGYPELTGDISIKLGRYLESDIRYKHYLFDSFTLPAATDSATEFSESPTQFKQFEPALVLNLREKNKTASKKVNYIDHPIIGSLLYFEPIELEDAIEQIAQQSLPAETGASLTYDRLNSTNELSN